ncbi:hypothetical protein SKAU_G00407650 [Synaphobranchus kaupii]|uniref:Uncharacterized protein n=1 Tax=Synaphobranchus kaupii TaxID=118154 RepID=A0A9Q1EAC3_SYNKA|nr:hypothetical protein SKAU_G00407650 [Synaphobranchus kaupii]
MLLHSRFQHRKRSTARRQVTTGLTLPSTEIHLCEPRPCTNEEGGQVCSPANHRLTKSPTGRVKSVSGSKVACQRQRLVRSTDTTLGTDTARFLIATVRIGRCLTGAHRCDKVCPRFVKMAERTPWWRAFMTRKSSPGSKDQACQPHSTDSETQIAAGSSSTPAAGLQEDLASSSPFSGETDDDAQLEPLFNEQTCRRNLKVSRSGRFKEKRRARASLPENYQGETATRKDDTR